MGEEALGCLKQEPTTTKKHRQGNEYLRSTS